MKSRQMAVFSRFGDNIPVKIAQNEAAIQVRQEIASERIAAGEKVTASRNGNFHLARAELATDEA